MAHRTFYGFSTIFLVFICVGVAIAIIDTAGGTSDARFIHKYYPTVEIGLLGKTAHQVNECSSLSDLMLLSNVYKQIILSCCQAIEI